ncbi:MAG: T9SS type A sorting domain-containing protein [Bacteroidota bacterium]|nr:T9SS type A sorting domain-containing protein [Bacteroidota bacterium]
MKTIIICFLLITGFAACAQWSNTTNLFYDSLHTPVSTATKTQQHPIVVQSYPDGGYFIIWEDYRNDPGPYNAKGIIYSQKYDKDGNQLWANNGVPVSAGTNNQHYYFGSNQDYRNRSYAATDSAGGFYITYADDSTTNYIWERACVQHMRSNGSAVFSGVGYIVATSTEANLHVASQLIADGNKGFFVSFINVSTSIYIFCFRDNNGVMQYYGGGIMDENAIQRTDPTISPCGNYRTYVEYPGTTVIDYNIWGDMQGGCNIVMLINGNTGDQYQMLTFNKLFRAKKNSTSTQYIRNTDYTARPIVTSYGKDSVYRLYFIKQDQQTTVCGTPPNVTTVTSQRLLQNGYQLIDGSYTSYNGGGYDYNYPKGTIVPTPGNINTSLMAVLKRTYQNNTLSNFTVQGYGFKEEKYDSIPYQRTSSNNPDIGYNPIAPPMDKLNNFRDTILAQGNYFYDFSLAGGGNQIFSSANIPEPATANSFRSIRLQHLAVERKSADSFAIVYKTTKKIGEMIGENIGYYDQYDFPLVTVNSTGNALFYLREYAGPARVSPVYNGAELAWGALGRTVGTGTYIGGSYLYYHMAQPFVALDPLNGTGVISWDDDRGIPGNTGENIFMRHLDSLNIQNHYPPYKRARFIYNVYGPTPANPNPYVLLGSSKRYSLFEGFSASGSDPGTSPVTEILDNNFFGSVTVSLYDNIGAIRTYNSKPYLDRNYTIKSDSIPPGANINLRLFFTTAEFDALKAANPTIPDPGYLAVIRQPNTSSGTPSAYTPVAGEQVLVPTGWRAIAGGYYIEIVTTALGNFFINGNFPALWTGVISTDWNTTGNWSDNTIPVATSNVTIPTGAANMPVLASGVTINNLTLQSATTLTLNGQTLTANGVVSGSGSFTGSAASSLTVGGSGSVINFTQTSAATRSLNNLALNSGSSVTLGNAMDVFGAITLTSATLNLNTKSVTLKSTATGTARIGDLTGSSLSNANNITIERYNTNRRAWRLLSIPFSASSQSIKGAWMEGAINVNDNPAPGYGTHITTFTGDANASNFDAQKPGSSIRTYSSDNFNSDAAHTPNTLNNITGSSAYFLFVRGDRSVDRTLTTTSSSTVLRTNGTIKQGNITGAGITGSFSLIPNPYPSPINFDAVKALNTSINTFYVWDPALGPVGNYRTVQISGNAPNYTYTATPGSADNNWRFIESGAAFMILGAGTVNFTENTKAAGSPPLSMFRTFTNNDPELIINLYTVNGGNANLADGVREVFNNIYSTGIDKEDAKKVTGFELNLGIANANDLLSVEKRPLPKQEDVIPLKIWNPTSSMQGDYQFEVQPNNFPSSITPYLKDNYLNTQTVIDKTSATNINFSITADAASAAAYRFSIIFDKPSGNTSPAIVIYPNPVNNGTIAFQFKNMPEGNYRIKLLNILGQSIINKQVYHSRGNSTEKIFINRVKGTYTIQITKPDNSKQTNKVVIN